MDVSSFFVLSCWDEDNVRSAFGQTEGERLINYISELLYNAYSEALNSYGMSLLETVLCRETDGYICGYEEISL